jgi:hypothetical protein
MSFYFLLYEEKTVFSAKNFSKNKVGNTLFMAESGCFEMFDQENYHPDPQIGP